MFPIRDTRGRVVGFGGRIVDAGEPKYLNSPETPLFHKGRELYGLFEARRALRHLPRLLVVEGYMDVLALAQHGIRYAVATLGTAATSEHLRRLFRIVDDVAFCFDGDAAGRRAAWRALENALPLLHDGRQVRFLFLPEGEDPDSLVRAEGREAFEARIESGQSLSKFMLDSLSAQTNLETPDGRARLIELARPLVAALPVGIFRHMLIEQLERLARINVERLSILNRDSAVRRPQAAARRPVSVAGPVRRALVMLLHRPALATAVDVAGGLPEVDDNGVAVLREVLDFLKEHPQISTAGVVEHWRGGDIGVYLLKLSETELVTPEEGLEVEFRALIRALNATRPAEQRLERLWTEATRRALSEAEKGELKQLLGARRCSQET
jgi:DNA primase